MKDKKGAPQDYQLILFELQIRQNCETGKLRLIHTAISKEH